MATTLTAVPEYARDPIRIAATLAANERDGKPTVEIICAVPAKGLWCSNLLGGLWVTQYGAVITINRLDRGDGRAYYKRVSYNREERLRIWKKEGFVVEEPVLFRLGGEWRRVPGEEEHATVRCLRHGTWLLNLDAVVKKLAEARTVGKALKYGTAPST
jgi:hypothetical protein